MFVFFTIPWIFVIALVVIALGIGVSALQFILDHIIIIFNHPRASGGMARVGHVENENSSDEEKVGWTLYLLFSGSGVCRADTTDSDRPQCAG